MIQMKDEEVEQCKHLGTRIFARPTAQLSLISA